MPQLISIITDWLGRKNETTGPQIKFIDLAPTDKADEAGVYQEALTFATRNPKVSNIALTGPYGSGKSSIIKSFLKTYRQPVLQISLAAFLPEATSPGGQVSKQEIERSILQQMLYGADANRLPLSRFKRIKAPKSWSVFLSLYAMLGVTACWHLFRKREAIIDGSYFHPLASTNLLNLAWFLIGFSFVWSVLNYLYRASFGVSLKSVSLKDIEITPAAISEESILNRHLDEIIYFFQSTRYDLVIIEDLDRFNNSDIFVTLREINSLVNGNAGVRRTIRFLYALRDDMFLNTDRTKFFEFIIPVIPIINSSNSIDKVLEQGKRLSLDERLDTQFLREVSRYLNDLRLIQNIFNEYAIYVSNLETEGDNVLDATKLLAILIYKNVFPKDFESLHRGKGNLAEILDRHDEFIANGEAEYKARIDAIEQQMDDAERQVPNDLLDLRRIYLMALLEKIGTGSHQVGLNHQSMVAVATLAQNDALDRIIKGPNVVYTTFQGYPQNANIAQLEAEVDPNRTFQQRKDEIARKAAESRSAATRTLRGLRTKASALRTAKFNEVIRLQTTELETLFEAFGDNHELARFLILEGHLDDTYYQYTSLFHSGRLSRNDNKYLIQIRGFINPDPGFQIDNPKEVMTAMRDEDFGQPYVLNVVLVDCLLGEAAEYHGKIQQMLAFLVANFDASGAFFTSYFATGKEVARLLDGVLKAWPDYISTVISDTRYLQHVAQIVARLPIRSLDTLSDRFPEIADFASSNLAEILALGIETDPVRLKALGIEATDLPSVDGFPGIARFLVQEELYTLTVANLEYIFRSVLGIGDLEPMRTRCHTTVIAADYPALSSRIEHDFGFYLAEILLKLPGNSGESIDAVLDVIGREDLSFEDRRLFLERQSAVFPSLDGVPEPFHAFIFASGRVEPTWRHCLDFMERSVFDAESLTTYLDSPSSYASLTEQPIPEDESASTLRRFLIKSDSLTNDHYRGYVRSLPTVFIKFPVEIGEEKLRIVIEEERVEFSKDNLDYLAAHGALKSLFAVLNIDALLSEQTSLGIDDDFRETLLGEDIGDPRKLAIIAAMDLEALPSAPKRAGTVGIILERNGADLSAMSVPSIRVITLNASPISVQISLFNRARDRLQDEDVRDILSNLPAPYSDIRTGYRTPRLKNTEINVQLAKWLDERKIISSWNETLFGDEIKINLYRS